jgi:hypothetical protein
MEYAVHYWGPLLFKTKISAEFLNFLDKMVKETKEEKLHFEHGVVKLKDEYYVSLENQNIFTEYMSDLLNGYNYAFENEWYPNREERVTQFNVDRVWVNWQGPNEMRSPHVHGGDLSFVIYQDVPEEMLEESAKEPKDDIKPGNIVFYHTMNPETQVYPPIIKHTATPQRGECYIFPADLFHYTIPFQSDCTRVSISGNVNCERVKV